LPLTETNFASRLAAVEERIRSSAERSGRSFASITLVAVSKKFSASAMMEAYAAGIRHFGENYVQELAAKKPDLAGLHDATFHLIGHLQSNKTNQACGLFQVIHTIDSPKLLQRLDVAAVERNTSLDALLEIKLSDEETKSGTEATELPRLLDAAASCRNVKVVGLMTMPPWSEDAELSRPYFRRLAELARKYGLPQLSMGMSNDFEVAIEEGATLIRVGTALFGARPKPVEKISSD
jgi:hypothetical protein